MRRATFLFYIIFISYSCMAGKKEVRDKQRKYYNAAKEIEIFIKDSSIKNEDKLIEPIRIEALFPTGNIGWDKFMRKHLNTKVLKEKGAAKGSYKINYSFIVEKDGYLTAIKVDDSPYGMTDEVERVLKLSPKWLPAETNGRKIIFRINKSIILNIK